jgi:hypothetical protein
VAFETYAGGTLVEPVERVSINVTLWGVRLAVHLNTLVNIARGLGVLFGLYEYAEQRNEHELLKLGN